MKKLYSKKLGGEAFALDAAQLDILKKAGYTVLSPEEVIADAAAVKIEHREVDDDLTDVVPGDLAAACLHIVQQAADVCGFHAEFVRAQAEVRRGGQRLHRLRAVVLIDEKKDLV